MIFALPPIGPCLASPRDKQGPQLVSVVSNTHRTSFISCWSWFRLSRPFPRLPRTARTQLCASRVKQGAMWQWRNLQLLQVLVTW